MNFDLNFTSYAKKRERERESMADQLGKDKCVFNKWSWDS